MKTQLYKYDGTPLFEVIVDDTSSQDWSLMSDNKLSVSFELEECVVLTAGCYIDFDSTRFYLLNEYKPTMICSSVWKYDLTLGDAASWLSITLALKTIDGENTPLFKYTGPAAEHAAIIVANLNRRMGTDQWKVGSVISTENIAIDYSGKYCSDVLQEIVDAKNTEWWIDGMTLNIGRAEFGESVTLGYMNGVLGDIVCDTAGDMRSYAYLFPIGSTRNIDPTKYGHDRLQLPSGLVSVPINPEQGVAELKEEAAFAHIYPRYEGTVSAVRYAKATNADGTPFLIYYIKDTAIPFNPNEFEIPGLKKHITFQSGELMGQEFEVTYSADSNEFELITRWTGDIQLPGGVLVPAVGDKYVVWNISMPDVYYTIASHELLDAARAYAADAIKDVSVYKVKLDYIDVQERGLKLRPGQRVRLLSNEYFASGYYDSRITRITRNISYPDELSVDISAVRVVGTLSRLQASIQKTENVVAQFSGQLPAIIKSNDDTSADDSSVYTSAKSEKEFLNKRKGGKVAAPITFDEVAEFLNGLVAHKYIKIGNGYLRYNDELGVWEMVGDLLVTGAVTMFGSLSGFKPSTIMDAVQVDNETIIKVKDAQGNWVLRALGGGGSGGTGGSLTAAEVNVLISEYLAKNSYATQSWVQNQGYLTTHQSISHLLSKTDAADTYQPIINSSNKLAYSLISGTPDLNVYFRSSDFTKSNIKSTLGISDWALAATKPSYTAAEVGALATSGGTLESSSAYPLTLKTSNANIGIALRNGSYNWGYFLYGGGANWYITDNGASNVYNILHSGNIGSYNAGSATKLQTARTIWGQTFDGSKDINGTFRLLRSEETPPLVHSILIYEAAPYGLLTRINTNGSVSLQAQREANDAECFRLLLNPLGGDVAVGRTTADAKLHVGGSIRADYDVVSIGANRSAGGFSLSDTGETYCGLMPNRLITSSGQVTDIWLYNNTKITYYASAHEIINDVTINGNILGGEATFSSNNSCNLYLNALGQSVSFLTLQIDSVAKGYVGYSKDGVFLQNGTASWAYITVSDDGKFVTSCDAVIGGNLLVSGAITMFSQLSMKNVIDYDGLSLAQLAQIRPARFAWKDNRDNRTHVGCIADYIQPILPEVVYETANKELTVDYGSAAFYIGASLIKPVIDHERRISDLERENKQLKQQLGRLSAA